MVLFQVSVLYARKDDDTGEVSRPVAENKNNISQGIIIDPNEEIGEINPLHPEGYGIDYAEKESVNNFVVDLNTIENRIKYFSPTYLNIRATVAASLGISYYGAGGDDSNLFNRSNLTDDLRNLKNDYTKEAKSIGIELKKELAKGTSADTNRILQLKSNLDIYTALATEATYEYVVYDKTILTYQAATKQRSAKRKLVEVDKYTATQNAREQVVQGIKTLVITYLKLSKNVDLLDKKQKIMGDMYELTLKNNTLGLSTALEVSESLEEYEDAKTSYKTTFNTLKNLKQQLAVNLGYELKDIDRLVFVEPEIDLDYLNNIDFEKDKIKACTSNSLYKEVKMKQIDKKLPDSDGKQLVLARKEANSAKIITSFENLYKKLQSAIVSYRGSFCLSEIWSMTNEANKRKLDNDLVSDLEYKGLELSNLANELMIKIAKYDLISISNDYYYATLGHLNIG